MPEQALVFTDNATIHVQAAVHFLTADRLGLSGVLATVTAGLLVGTVGPLGTISALGRESVNAFWENAAFIAAGMMLPGR